MFKYRVAKSTGEILSRERRPSSICFDQGFISTKFFRLVNRTMPRVEPHVDFLIESQGGEMTVATPNVINRRGQRQILIIRTFYSAQKGAEVRQVTQLKK